MAKNNVHRAIFLDRDGVLIRDTNLLTDCSALEILPGVPEALRNLKQAGFALLVVTNQTVISRGLMDEASLVSLHTTLHTMLGGTIDRFYYCPHHPHADVEAYRRVCSCRKPDPGMLLRGAKEFQIDLTQSWIIGDRPSDIVAGQRAGCNTILLETGAHLDAPIQSPSMPTELPVADHVCSSLCEASKLILTQ